MPRLAPAVATARRAVRSLLSQQLAAGHLSAGDLVLVACSGGADSLALAAATGFVAPRLGLRAGAVSVDHGLQPGSAAVSERAVLACARLGLEPSWVERATVGGHAHGGPEARARRVRYAALHRAVARTGASAVLLGHTMDDQAETVLLGLSRGSGARSLAGMPAARGVLLRPLLGMRRAETLAACEALALDVWHDPANAADGPLRTAAGEALPRAALRERVLPALEAALGPGVVPALGRTASSLRDDADYLDAAAAALLEAARDDAPGSHAAATDPVGSDAVVIRPAALDTAVLRAAHPALRRRALLRAAVEAGAPAGDLGDVHVRAVDALITDWHGQGPVHLPGPTEALRACGRLVLRPSARDLGRPAGPTLDALPHTDPRET